MQSLWAKILATAVVLVAAISMWLMAIYPGHIYSARYAGTVTSRPEDRVPIYLERPYWHRIDLDLDRKALTTSRAMQSTFWISLTDCHESEIYPGHVFVNGVDIFQIAYLSQATYNDLLKTNSGETIQASIYIDDENFNRTSKLCLRAGGGTMYYYGFKGNLVKVARTP